jgi:hypothetical protein
MFCLRREPAACRPSSPTFSCRTTPLVLHVPAASSFTTRNTQGWLVQILTPVPSGSASGRSCRSSSWRIVSHQKSTGCSQWILPASASCPQSSILQFPKRVHRVSGARSADEIWLLPSVLSHGPDSVRWTREEKEHSAQPRCFSDCSLS